MNTKKYALSFVVILSLIVGFLPTQSMVNAAYPCPCSIWSPADIPVIPAQAEAKPVELGVKFKTADSGYITGLRFYKGTGNTGTHYGHLWTTDGTLLGTVTFANETSTGWQEGTFPTPIPLAANTPYIASYHTTTGHWSLTSGGLTAQVSNLPLTALATSDSTSPGNGVYKYGPSGSFPDETVSGSNYWVDVVFNTTVASDTTPPTVSSVTPVNGSIDVDRGLNLTVLFSEGMNATTITSGGFELRDPSNNLVPATVTYVNGSYTATMDPTAVLANSTTYTATIKGGSSGVTDLAGNPLAADYSWSFTTAAPDLTAPTVSAVTPVNLATGVDKNINVTARFSEAMNAATINSSNFELRDPSATLIPATVTYVNGTYTATLDPTSPLANSTTYTALIKGGSSGVTDLAANPLAVNYTWSFTTAASPDEGPGGPILVIADSGNPFGRFYAEILRTEGLNEFAVMDRSLVTAQILENYDVVILGEMSLSTDNVTMFSNWVTSGGNLIAMRPDKQLAGLLGLTEAVGVLPPTGTLNAYLLVNTSVEPGKGIVNETIQYHGLADLYTLNTGTTAVATLYSTATTATSNPAVTIRSVGSNGGQAAAFTYDLARSVVYTRQGNPAWAGQNRDINDPSVSRIISHDLYFGNLASDPQPDYVDFNKLTIPQADEQQRLLANLIQFMNSDKKPLPHFWYFPNGEKAVVIMTGDDHGGGTGTIGRFDTYKAISTPGCSVDNWECIRSSSYMLMTGAMTDVQAAGYNADGFEIGLHVNTNCVDWTPSSLVDFYQNQLTSWYVLYPSLPGQISERTHCVNWTDWVTQAKVQASHGIRMDTNYYYYPPAWVLERPGMFTGSGMPMRFADLDGTMIDVYQAVTQMTDESSLQGYGYFNPLQINTLLDNAVGTPGYYGAFLANMHTDGNPHPGSVTIINAAVSRGVPVVSGRQMVNWLDGRNASSFDAISWSGGTLSFSITRGAGSNGIQAMLPTSTKAGFLTEGFITGITRGGVPVTFTKQTIKGIEYAFFDAVAGNYAVTYAPDLTGPVITNVTSLPTSSGTALITWTTDELSTSRVDYGTNPDTLGSTLSNAALVTAHQINLTGLALGQTYYFRVTSVDSSANSTTYPLIGDDPLTFIVPTAHIIDTTVADFSAGSLLPNTYITSAEDGEVVLSPAAGSEFFGSTLPAGWFIAQYPTTSSDGTAIVSGGLLTMDGTRVGTNATFGPGRSIDFVATFTAGLHQHVGLGVDFTQTPWAIFSTDATGTVLQARSNNAATPTPTTIDTTISGSWFGTPHHYRIEWNPTNIVYYIDGVQVASHTITIAAEMRPMAAEYTHGAQILTVDWLRMSPYLTPGTFTSRVWDAVGTADWGAPEWLVDLPAGTSLTMSVRTGDTPVPDGTWSSYTPMTYGEPIGRSSRYLQYTAEFAASDSTKTPILRQVAFGYVHHPDVTPPTIVSRSPAPGSIDVPQNSNILITFSEAMNSATLNGTTIRLRRIGATEDVAAVVSYTGLTATLNPTPILTLGALYQVTVASSVADLTGNLLGIESSWTFTTANAGSFTDNTFADFSAGTPSGTYVAETQDGEVILAPMVGAEFSGIALPADWFTAQYSPSGTGGTAPVSGGLVTLNGVRIGTNATFGPGRWLEVYGIFNSGVYQHIGLGLDYNTAPYSIFSTTSSATTFQARSAPSTETTTALTSYFGAPHLYRIEWNINSIVYYIDGVQVASHPVTIGASMRPMPAAYGGSSGRPMILNWLRMGPYSTSGTFISRVFDATDTATWTNLTATINQPAGTTTSIDTRTSSDGLSWSDWMAVNPDNSLQSPNGRYFQYRLTFSAPEGGAITPVVENVTINFSITPRAVLSLQASWNLITLPLQPAVPYTPESLLLALNAQGGNCTSIYHWDVDGWESHHLGLPFGTFPITMGQGYFVLCTQSSTFIQQGNRLSSGATLSLISGYNLVGFPYPGTGQTAQSVLEAITNQGGNCPEMYRWDVDGWVPHFTVVPTLNNFSILPSEGYFVRCTVGSSFTP